MYRKLCMKLLKWLIIGLFCSFITWFLLSQCMLPADTERWTTSLYSEQVQVHAPCFASHLLRAVV